MTVGRAVKYTDRQAARRHVGARLVPSTIQRRVADSRPTQCILSPCSSNKWVDVKAFPERGRPTQTRRLTPAFLPQQGEHGVVRAGLGAWDQLPKVADVVPVRRWCW